MAHHLAVALERGLEGLLVCEADEAFASWEAIFIDAHLHPLFNRLLQNKKEFGRCGRGSAQMGVVTGWWGG